MPETIRSLHVILTLIAFGILVGAGWALIHMAIVWPGTRVNWAAAIVCVLILALAWLA